MEHDSGRSRMGLAVLVSLLVHAAVILLVPVANPGRIVIYPVEFGEIEQTFESPRVGSPDGDVVAAPQPEMKQASPAVRGDGPETQVAVKPALEPAQKPAPEPKPAPSPSPKPAPKPKQQAPEPGKVQVTGSREKQQHPKPESAPGEQARPVQAENRPPSRPASAEAETTSAGTGAGRGATTADTTHENVLTGKSEETVPAPPAGAGGGGGAAAPGTVPASGAAAGAGEEAGQTTAGSVGPSGPGGQSETAAPAAPPRPRGEEFGTGRALVLSGVPPVYPKNAQNEGVEGVVTLSVTVDAFGAATKVAVTAGSGDPRLDEAAMRTISRGWHFQAIGWPYELAVRVTFKKGSVELAFGGVKVLGD